MRERAVANAAAARASRRADEGGGALASLRGRLSSARILSVPSQLMGPRLLFVLCAFALCALGLVMVYSTSVPQGGVLPHDFRTQLMGAAIGVVAFVVCAMIPYSFWSKPLVFRALWCLTCVLLVACLLFGTEINGAKRWILGFQPSELAKFAVLVTVASLVSMCRDGSLEYKSFVVTVFVAIALPLGLIVVQPDFGTALILAVGILVVFVLAGVRLRPILVVLCVLAAVGTVYVLLSLSGGGSQAGGDYHADRIQTLLDPWADDTGDGRQTIQSIYAFMSGGLFGKGLGFSHQKFAHLTQANNDFIFAIIGEELGLVGTVAVILLFAGLLYAGIRIARSAPDSFGCMVAGGIVSTIVFQAVINMAMTCGLIPVAGKTLPFVSSGGTSLVMTLAMCGVVLSVSLHSVVGAAHERRRDDLRVYEGGKRRNSGSRRAGESMPSGVFAHAKSARDKFARDRSAKDSRVLRGSDRAPRPSHERGGAPGRASASDSKVVSIGRAAESGRDGRPGASGGSYKYGQSIYARRRPRGTNGKRRS